jgi:carotenoid cleavage dioxygenase-like enzyme
MHSFGATENFLILLEFPLRVNPLRLLVGARSFIESFNWQSSEPARFLIFDKDDGSFVQSFEADPLFAFHHVNAFEEAGRLLVDIVAYSDARVISDLFLHRVRSGRNSASPVGELRRYCLAQRVTRASYEVLSQTKLELPVIDSERESMVSHRNIYGVGAGPSSKFTDKLVKIDVYTGRVQTWQSEHCYPGEPVYVRQDNCKPGDSVILSVVLDAENGHSFLVVLDSQTFVEIGRAEVPHTIPFGFHGKYICQESSASQ